LKLILHPFTATVLMGEELTCTVGGVIVWQLNLALMAAIVLCTMCCAAIAYHLISTQIRGPAEFKHITKRRKRNQLGFPQ
jgi:hypothetical protein